MHNIVNSPTQSLFKPIWVNHLSYLSLFSFDGAHEKSFLQGTQCSLSLLINIVNCAGNFFFLWLPWFNVIMLLCYIQFHKTEIQLTNSKVLWNGRYMYIKIVYLISSLLSVSYSLTRSWRWNWQKICITKCYNKRVDTSIVNINFSWNSWISKWWSLKITFICRVSPIRTILFCYITFTFKRTSLWLFRFEISQFVFFLIKNPQNRKYA